MERLILLICAYLLAQLAWPQSPTIVGYEYWFNQDHPNREYVAVAPGQVVTLQDEELTVPEGLPIGTHTVHFRWKDVAPGGAVRWSTVVSRPFQKHHAGPWELVALRYWVGEPANGSDPSIRYVEIDPPQTQLDLVGPLDLCDFPVGNNQTLKLQLLDNHGQWSSVVTRPVNIDSTGTLGMPSITANPNAFCPGDTVILTAIPPSGPDNANPTSYSWTVPEVNGWSHEPSSSSAITVVVGDGPGVAEVFTLNECGTSATASLLMDPTEPEIVFIEPPAAVSVGETITLSIEPVDGASYLWTYPLSWDTDDSTSSSLVINVGGPLGVDSVCVQLLYGQCVVESCLYIDVVVGLSEHSEQGGLTIYPNPSGSLITVAFTDLGEAAYFELYDLMGRRVMELGPRAQAFTVDLSGLASGTYILRWANDAVQGRQPIVIQR